MKHDVIRATCIGKMIRNLIVLLCVFDRAISASLTADSQNTRPPVFLSTAPGVIVKYDGPILRVTREVEMQKYLRTRPNLSLQELLAQRNGSHVGSPRDISGKSPVAFRDDIEDHLYEILRAHERTKRQVMGSHIIETIIYIDYRLYESWLIRNSNNSVAAISEILDYYANTINAVNTRLNTLAMTGFTLQIQVNAFVVATNPGATPWTSNFENNNILDVNVSLASFESFLLGSGGSIGGIPYDHAMTITGFDLSRSGQNTSVGLAAIPVCNANSGSIHEDIGTEALGTIIAHGLGHALTASHDGDGNACLSADNFIMSVLLESPPAARASNPWTYSTCSKDSIGAYLQTAPAACTLTLSNLGVDISGFLTQQFGQKYPADVQCEIYFGTGSKFCREVYFAGGRTFSDMCREFYCLLPSDGNCYPSFAHDGTTCGSQRWCQQGQCVFDATAPLTPANCPAGDDPDTTCNPSFCGIIPGYATSICCATCNPVATAAPATGATTNAATRSATTASVFSQTTTNAPTTATTSGTTRQPTTASIFMTTSGTSSATSGTTRPPTTASLMRTTSATTNAPTTTSPLSTTASLFRTSTALSSTTSGTTTAPTTASLFGQTSSGTTSRTTGTATTASMFGQTTSGTTSRTIGTATTASMFGQTTSGTTSRTIGTATTASMFGQTTASMFVTGTTT